MRTFIVVALVLLGLVGAAAIVLLVARTRPGQAATFEHEVMRRLTPLAPLPPVTEADLLALPAPVQRYLRYVGVVGKPRVQNFRVVFRGQMRPSPSAGWMNTDVQQYNFLQPPARLFYVRAARFGLPFDAFHMYSGPRATFHVKLANLFDVVDAHGPEMDQSETVTMLNDLCLLAPAALIDADIVWQTIDERSVGATFTNAGHTVRATLTFAPDGSLSGFSSDDRAQTADGKTYKRFRWSTPVTNYRDFHGYRIAALGEAIWEEPAGPYSYARFEIAALDYNVSAPMR